MKVMKLSAGSSLAIKTTGGVEGLDFRLKLIAGYRIWWNELSAVAS